MKGIVSSTATGPVTLPEPTLPPDSGGYSSLTADDMIGAVRTFLDFLAMTEYPHPVQLTALQDADENRCVPLDKASIDAVLSHFADWLAED